GEVLGTGPHVDPHLARVGVLARERVDRVRQTALLAHLLEQARRGGAAEDRVEYAQGEAPVVVPRDTGRPQAHVVLLGVLALELERRPSGPRSAAERGRRGAGRGVAVAGHGHVLVVVHRAGRRDHDVGGYVA